MRHSYSPIVALAACLLFAPAGALQANESINGESSSPRTMGQTLDDANLTATVKAKLLADRGTPGLKIHVTTFNGIVSLTGQVYTVAERELAEELAADTTGVKDVVNQLTIVGS